MQVDVPLKVDRIKDYIIPYLKETYTVKTQQWNSISFNLNELVSLK